MGLPTKTIVDIVRYPGTVARGCVVDVSRDGDTCEKVAWKTRSASVLWRRCRRYWSLALRWPTHTDKPQSMQELRRRLLPRDDQEGYDAMTIRKDPHERVSYSARQTENPTDVIPPHNRALHTNRHINDLRWSTIYKSSATKHWLIPTGYVLTFPPASSTSSCVRCILPTSLMIAVVCIFCFCFSYRNLSTVVYARVLRGRTLRRPAASLVGCMRCQVL